MDDDMDMDDLFGDGAVLALPPRPPSKELYQRVDEMRANGCSQAIAWSRWGTVATISADGAALELRNLRSHPKDGTWALSQPTITPPLANTLDGGPLRYLSWSPTGSELAVVDSVGRVTIMGLFASLNKPNLHRPSNVDPVDDLHRVVGSFWLNLNPLPPGRPKVLNGPAIKEGSTYRYEVSHSPVLGPCHPSHSKSAFVCVTTNGLLRVLWPQINNKWYESHTELDSIVSSDDLITHAAICPDKSGTLLIAFATTSKELRTIRALIDWGQPKTNDKDSKQIAPLSPTIKTRHLAVTSWLQDGPGENVNASNLEFSMSQLSHLEVLPPSNDAQGQITPATIVAVRSHLPISMSQYPQDFYTTVDRWEVSEKAQVIHPAFEKMNNRRNSVGSKPGSIHYLKRLDSITINKVFINMQSMNLGRVLFFAYGDGSIEYRDRVTLSETFNDSDLTRVWHLSQIGFTYGEDEPCVQVALSPSYCSLVQIRNDGKVNWKRLTFPLGDIGSGMNDPQYAAVAAALALHSTNAVMRNVNYDDVLATAQKFSDGDIPYHWLTELSRILKVHVDYSEDVHFDSLIRNTSIQLTLCIRNSLGFRGEFSPRTFGGKLAWIILQLRNIVVLVTMALNMKPTEGPNGESSSPLDDPEIINALAGSVRWVSDLFAWLIDTLLNLPSTLPTNISLTDANNLSLPDLLEHLQSTNTVSLHLLLSSTSRGFLTAMCRRLVHLDYIARKAMHTSTTSSAPTPNPNNPNQSSTPLPSSSLSPALRAAYVQIATFTTETVLRFKTIEDLLLSLNARVKTAYAPASNPNPGSNQSGRNIQEMRMLFGGPLPDSFKSVIVELYRKEGLLEGVRNEIDPAKLYFANFEVLEIDEDAASIRARKAKNQTMDCFRKTWLANPKKVAGKDDNGVARKSATNGSKPAQGNMRQGVRWRRCTRCASVMEDALTQRQALQWLVMQSRRCYCSGYWVTLDTGEMML